MNKLFCNHEIRQFQKKLNVKTFILSKKLYEIGPNLIRCQAAEDIDFVIQPDKRVAKKLKWFIS